VRTIGGILAGLIAWMIGFYAIGIAFGLLWPPYAEAARHMFSEDDFSYFTVPMLFMNWTLFVGTGLFAGWVASWIGGNRKAPLIVAAVWFLYAVINHYWRVWNELPDWYNVIVPFVIAVPIFVWSRLGRSVSKGTSTAASQASR
jgi:hypothetical protein